MYFDPNQRLLQISIHYKFAEILFKVYVGFGFGSDIYKVCCLCICGIQNENKHTPLQVFHRICSVRVDSVKIARRTIPCIGLGQMNTSSQHTS